MSLYITPYYVRDSCWFGCLQIDCGCLNKTNETTFQDRKVWVNASRHMWRVKYISRRAVELFREWRPGPRCDISLVVYHKLHNGPLPCSHTTTFFRHLFIVGKFPVTFPFTRYFLSHFYLGCKAGARISWSYILAKIMLIMWLIIWTDLLLIIRHIYLRIYDTQNNRRYHSPDGPFHGKEMSKLISKLSAVILSEITKVSILVPLLLWKSVLTHQAIRKPLFPL